MHYQLVIRVLLACFRKHYTADNSSNYIYQAGCCSSTYATIRRDKRNTNDNSEPKTSKRDNCVDMVFANARKEMCI